MKRIRCDVKAAQLTILIALCTALMLLWPQWRSELQAQDYCSAGSHIDSFGFCVGPTADTPPSSNEGLSAGEVWEYRGNGRWVAACPDPNVAELTGVCVPETITVTQPPEPSGTLPIPSGGIVTVPVEPSSPPQPPPSEPPAPESPTAGTSPPSPPTPQAPPPKDVDKACTETGSSIAPQNQSMGEMVDLVGTPFQLRYQSDRVAGRSDAPVKAVAHAKPLGGWTLNVHHALDPAGPALFLGDGGRRSAEALGSLAGTSSGGFAVAAEDGSEVYIFDASGRHLFTLHALTGAVRYQFGYDAVGLATITDGDGNVTTIERTAAGVPAAIVAPLGQRTTLTLNAAGYLASIINPAGEETQFD
jgi:YD repeat-containing protein